MEHGCRLETLLHTPIIGSSRLKKDAGVLLQARKRDCIRPYQMWRAQQKAVKVLTLMMLLAAPCRGGPRVVEHRVNWYKVALLSSAQFGVDFWDMHQTRDRYLEAQRNNQYSYELNPLTNALLLHPELYYARPVATVALSAFLSYKLSTNRRPWVRRFRYAPQLVQISASTQGMIYSHFHWKR